MSASTTLDPSLLEALKKHDMQITPDFSGKFVRNGSQWAKGLILDTLKGPVKLVLYGDHARDLSEHWRSQGDVDAATVQRAMAQAQQENRTALEALWESTRQEVAAELGQFANSGQPPYLARKNLPLPAGCLVEPHALGERLIVPAQDADGITWGYQRIYPGKLPEVGTDKLFRKAARKEGCFYKLGIAETPSKIYLAEGLATALSVHLAHAEPGSWTLACFDAGNLLPVATLMRAKHPDCVFIFCADDDRHPGKHGQASHTGEKKATQAAQAVGNACVALPVFQDTHKASVMRYTDFDDLRQAEGLASVKACLDAAQALPPAPGTQAASQEPQGTTAQRARGLREAALVEALLATYKDAVGTTLVRQGRDFFVWTGTHWRHLDPLAAPDRLKAQLDKLAGEQLVMKDIASAYTRLLTRMPSVPSGVDLFAPNPFAQNFLNGTLHLTPQPGGKYALELRGHKRQDFLTHCHPFDYDADAPYNPEFEQAVDRIWDGDPEKEAKKQAYFEVLGACLLPAFRKIVMFVGKPKGGKSTLVSFAARMVTQEYRCSVDPSHMQGFNMQSMAGKLLNFDTDISLKRPIADDILKKIEDRQPMRIQRKGIADIYAPLPGMHLFAANAMPQSQEAGSAYNRRVLVFECNSYEAPADYRIDFANWVWDQGPGGIVRRAIEGLKALCDAGGHFTVPHSSRARVSQWQEENMDLVAEFVRGIDEGEVVDENSMLMRGPGLKIERLRLWSVFEKWTGNSALVRCGITRFKLYARLRELGIREKKIDGVKYFDGVGSASKGQGEV